MINTNNIDFYSENIIKNILLKFNNVIREDSHSKEIYGLLEKFYSGNNIQDKFKYLYTFEKSNNKNSSNGYCNTASLNDIKLEMDLKYPSKFNENFKYNIYIYISCYNIIEFKYGKGYLKFGN